MPISFNFQEVNKISNLKISNRRGQSTARDVLLARKQLVQNKLIFYNKHFRKLS